MTGKTVTVFGSSRPAQHEDEWQAAYELGRLLGAAGLNVCNGGHLGIMEAVSKGAVEEGAEAIGITMSRFLDPNTYLTRHIACESLFERLGKLVSHGDAFVILQGGTGTLLELALIWEYMNKGFMETKPVATHSSMWESIVGTMDKQVALEKRKSGLIKTFSGVSPLAEYIISSLKG